MLVKRVFGAASMENIREMRKQNPGLYESRIQSYVLSLSRWMRDAP
jgi:hypothetical protein